MPCPVTVTGVAEIQGTCDKRFDAVRVALAESLDDADVGAAAAVFIDGEPVADLWGGYTDAQRTTRWQQDTITNVWSTTKTMVALCALILADRGDLYDWPAAIDRLAKQAPRWEPGTLAGYHSVTQGFLVGEVVRRVTGHSLAAFFADQVAGPLGADFHLTLPADHDRRFAPGLPPPDAPDGDLTAAPPDGPEPPAGTAIRLSDGNSVAWRRAEMLSASGYGNARSVAAVQSVLACGGSVHGTRLLSKQACERAREEQYRGIDQLLGSSVRYGMGYGIFDRAVGWGGWGGSMVMVNMDSRMTVAYAMNQMLQGGSGDYRGLGIVLAAYDGLES
jgi:CubicO group peptidase (beta-lactamase class C family)